MIVDAVFEGGGIKGLSFLGAVEVMEEAGYEWGRVAGTSAGSILAALLAVGLRGKELRSAFLNLPFHTLEKKQGICRIPFVGPWLSLGLNNGIYSLAPLENWIKSFLRKTGKITFGDLPEGKLRIVVTDITQNKMCILPDDLPSYGIDPSSFPIAWAVCMSCSIPFIFRPRMLAGNIIVDGAVLSNYPIWLFDAEEEPRWPTFGFRLSGKEFIHSPQKVKGPFSMSLALIKTMVDGHDNRYINSHNAARTIFIKGIPHSATEFGITDKQKLELIELGRTSAADFLIHWNFEQYLASYRPYLKKPTKV